MIENFNIQIKELEKNFINNKTEEEINIFYEDLNEQLEKLYEDITDSYSSCSYSDNNSIEEIYNDIEKLLYDEYNLLTVKQLNHIMNYYNLKKEKNKYETIWKIIEFESNMDNIYFTEKRRELWKYINELKKDKYLSKFITI